MRLIVLFFLLPGIYRTAFSQDTASLRENEQPKVKWYTIEEAAKLTKENPKKILVDMYTEWCGWCKKMDQATFGHPNIAAYINQYFYAVKFDAECIDTIEFNGKTYVNEGAEQIKAQGIDGRPRRKPAHQLASELAKGRLSYPTIIYLDENLNNLSPVPGYKTPLDIEIFLMYFGENVYKTIPWAEYERCFNRSFKETADLDTARVKWYSLQEALELNSKEPRKIFIDLYVSWSGLGRMMYYSTYNDSVIAAYLNNNFYPVRFNAISKDTLEIFGTKMINESKEHPFHQFGVTALQGKMIFPVILFMDENNHLISAVPEYRSPENLEPILKFFKEDIYKDKPYEQFLKTFKSSIPKEATTSTEGQ